MISWGARDLKVGAVVPVTIVSRAPDADLRKDAVEALGHIGTKDAITGITRALTDKDPQVRKAAVEALGETKDG